VTLPEEELNELAELLDSGALVVLRDRYDRPRRTKQPLQRYSDRIWLFPFGTHPDPGQDVTVFRNGLPCYMGHEAELVRVGRSQPISVVVFQIPTRELDKIQASYICIPQVVR
jgi:hypothetical protein